MWLKIIWAFFILFSNFSKNINLFLNKNKIIGEKSLFLHFHIIQSK